MARKQSNRTLFGKLLEQYRIRAGVRSQVELQRKLSEQGHKLHVSTLNMYESGKRRPPPDFIPAVAKCLGLNEDERDTLFKAPLTDVVENLVQKYRESCSRE